MALTSNKIIVQVKEKHPQPERSKFKLIFSFPIFSQMKPQYSTNYGDSFFSKKGRRLEAKKASDNIIMNLTMRNTKNSSDQTMYNTTFNNWLSKKAKDESKPVKLS